MSTKSVNEDRIRESSPLFRLDDLRHRAMCVGQAPHDPRAVRELANVLQDVISEVSRLHVELHPERYS